MTGGKRLTPPQSRKVNSLVKKECCNCERGHCILLDDGEECVCPQLISYSLLCKWFQIAVLPLDKLLYAELFKTEDKKRCTECGTFFVSKSNSVKYCPDCRKRIMRPYPLPCGMLHKLVLSFGRWQRASSAPPCLQDVSLHSLMRLLSFHFPRLFLQSG